MAKVYQKDVKEKLSFKTPVVIESTFEELLDIRGALNSAIIRADDKKYSSTKRRYEELEKVVADFVLYNQINS